jgi:hypothetical protein
MQLTVYSQMKGLCYNGISCGIHPIIMGEEFMILRTIITIICAGLLSTAGAQGFKKLLDITEYNGQIIIPGLRYYQSDPKTWDIDGKGSFVFEKAYLDSIIFIDCATFTMKFRLNTVFEQHHVWPIGFFDIDGDNSRELLVSAGSDTGNHVTEYWFLDVATQTIKYKMGILPPASIVDINKDSYPEVICFDNSNWIQIWGNSKTAIQPLSQPSLLKKLATLSNAPNPFREITRIEYYLPQKNNLLLRIFNADGELVRTLVNEQKEMGEYSVLWDGRSDNNVFVASGNYYYQMKIGDFISSKRMILIK